MNNNHLDPTEESLRDADAAGRIRARLLIALGLVVTGWVLADGLLLYDQLPDRLPTHFGAGGLPNAYGAKNVFNVFGALIIGGALLIAMALLRQKPRWYNFPGSERARLLPPEEQSHVYAPLQESLAWMGAGEAIGMALLSRQTWAAAMHQREGISLFAFLVPMVAGIGAVLAATVAAVRRLKAQERRREG
jgi:hypothetical protein